MTVGRNVCLGESASLPKKNYFKPKVFFPPKFPKKRPPDFAILAINSLIKNLQITGFRVSQQVTNRHLQTDIASYRLNRPMQFKSMLCLEVIENQLFIINLHGEMSII